MAQPPALEPRHAAALLDRLDDVGLGEELAEENLLQPETSAAFRTVALQLASTVFAVAPDGATAGLQAALKQVRHAAENQSDGGGPALDQALLAFLRVLQPGTAAVHRLQVAEELVAYLQAVRLAEAAAAGKLQAAPEPIGAEESAAAELATAIKAACMDDGAEVSSQLCGLAEALQVTVDGRGAGEVVADVQARVDKLLEALPPDFNEPLLTRESLSEAQLKQVLEIDEALRSQHLLRRQMLVERAKVTLQSFLWSKRLQQQGTEAQARAAADAGIAAMSEPLSAKAEDIFEFRQVDLAAISARVTNGSGGGTRASVKDILIGAVPDRGGRAEGREAAAKMPQWAPR
eukprot:CAMPEP_0206141654 /NCGR_PEP_ID=MMETSP1473-20131121/13709_1 /ASSEMBLY_ACC=CAM_ASM_001109 /TAXON_ID=1461547 /ORGANISM="Stichococcus sp, Strain RCC1054" /LENGTH=347 /DNA_ID=CAMNT_0053536315 /DNA_START=412 /DNA_END=1451 /DNA_ORIENTATION=-